MQVSGFVPSDRIRFLSAEIFKAHWIFKYIKRQMVLWLSLQFLVERNTQGCLENSTRVLWVNLAAPSLGDSLMDLAGRVGLDGRSVDLLTSRQNISLYQSDTFFHRVTSSVSEARSWNREALYDVIILDSYAPRVLMKKLLVSWMAPIAPIYGFINGFEIHRTYYSFRRLEYLFGVKGNYRLKPTMTLPASVRSPHKHIGAICFAIGGEWGFRTYRYWIDVIRPFVDKYPIVLVGSENGNAHASDILREYPQIYSYVGKISLLETASVIARARLFVGADGGLWHVACSLDVPSIVLFADCALFDESGQRVDRSTGDTHSLSLYDETEVSNIPVARIQTLMNQQLSCSVVSK